MASVGTVALTVDREIANANINVDYTINFSSFDVASDLPYSVSVRLIGDDTGFDNEVEGDDDAIGNALVPISVIRSRGRNSVERTYHTVLAYDDLDEDRWYAGDEEIRAVVDLTPMLPGAVSRESNLVTLPQIDS